MIVSLWYRLLLITPKDILFKHAKANNVLYGGVFCINGLKAGSQYDARPCIS